MNFLKLIDLYNQSIYKSAGLVKVPEKLLKQVEDYAINVYLKHCKLQLNSIKSNISKRNELQSMFDDQLDQLYELDKFISLGKIDTLTDKSGINITIPYFNGLSIDENTGLFGVYDWVNYPPALSIFIYKHNENSFNFSLNINHKEEIEVDIDLIKNITKDELIKLLYKNYNLIIEVYNDFYDFAHYKFGVYNEEYIKKINFLNGFINSKINDSDITKNIFTFSLNDFNLNIDSFQHFPLSKNKKEFKFKVIFASSAKEKKQIFDDKDWAGLWVPNRNSYPLLYVFQKIPLKSEINEKIINADILDIKNTVRHELQHAFQTFVERGKDLPESAGLPSKTMRDVKYDPWGRPISKKEDDNVDVKSSEKNDKEKDNLEHHKMDIEFYTDLTDSINRYKQFVRNIPKPLWKTVFLYWIDQIEDHDIYLNIKTYFNKLENKQFQADLKTKQFYKKIIGIKDVFFITLKADPIQQEKYKKAVKEFYKEVSSDFENSTI